MTAFTDGLIAVFSGYWAIRLLTLSSLTGMSVQHYWGYSYSLIALGSFLGTVSHGFGPNFPEYISKIIWKLTVVSLGWTSFFLTIGSLHFIFPLTVIVWLKWVPITLLVIYHVVILINDQFKVAILFYAPGMIFACIVFGLGYLTFGLGSAGIVCMGLLMSFIAAGVQMKGITIHKYFNHNDLYHIIQLVALYIIYRGISNLWDYSAR
jgi:hypothetical protein